MDGLLLSVVTNELPNLVMVLVAAAAALSVRELFQGRATPKPKK